uniref:Uncharacterized protein n=1 Tax=Arundo donax TaxID=35708 RepID=A0A0A9HLC2_ARUDO
MARIHQKDPTLVALQGPLPMVSVLFASLHPFWFQHPCQFL